SNSDQFKIKHEDLICFCEKFPYAHDFRNSELFIEIILNYHLNVFYNIGKGIDELRKVNFSCVSPISHSSFLFLFLSCFPFLFFFSLPILILDTLNLTLNQSSNNSPLNHLTSLSTISITHLTLSACPIISFHLCPFSIFSLISQSLLPMITVGLSSSSILFSLLLISPLTCLSQSVSFFISLGFVMDNLSGWKPSRSWLDGLIFYLHLLQIFQIFYLGNFMRNRSNLPESLRSNPAYAGFSILPAVQILSIVHRLGFVFNLAKILPCHWATSLSHPKNMYYCCPKLPECQGHIDSQLQKPCNQCRGLNSYVIRKHTDRKKLHPSCNPKCPVHNLDSKNKISVPEICYKLLGQLMIPNRNQFLMRQVSCQPDPMEHLPHSPKTSERNKVHQPVKCTRDSPRHFFHILGRRDEGVGAGGFEVRQGGGWWVVNLLVIETRAHFVITRTSWSLTWGSSLLDGNDQYARQVNSNIITGKVLDINKSYNRFHPELKLLEIYFKPTSHKLTTVLSKLSWTHQAAIQTPHVCIGRCFGTVTVQSAQMFGVTTEASCFLGVFAFQLQAVEQFLFALHKAHHLTQPSKPLCPYSTQTR
ncbi:hypothetical protein VP01_2539g1, partial [Puccinia sorghi]